MRNILILARKEWKNYFSGPLGFLFPGLLLTLANWLFMNDLFLTRQAEMKLYWGVVGFLLSIFVPAMAMGLLAEEKKNGTWELLLSLPIKDEEMVLGKFLGGAWYFLTVLGLTLPVAVTVSWLGRPDLGAMVGGYVGIVLLGTAYLSSGLFFSGLTNQPVAAFLTGAVWLIINNLMGQEIVASRLPWFLKGITASLSLTARGEKFSAGLVDIGDGVFFLSWTAVFLMLTVLSLKSRDK